MADDKTILEIGTLLEKIKKEEVEINNGIESLGGIDGKELGLDEILQMFEESKATFNSLLKKELPTKFGEKYDESKHNMGQLRNNWLKLKMKQNFILQMSRIR